MKTLMIIWGLFAVPVLVWGQVYVDKGVTLNSVVQTEYIAVNKTVHPFKPLKTYCVIDYGKNKEMRVITDANGEKMEFDSWIGMINYLAADGWEFVAWIPAEESKLDARVLMRRSKH